MTASFIRPTLMALLMGTCALSPIAPALAQQAPAAAPVTAENLATCKQIITNFQMYDMMVHGAMRAFDDNEELKALPQAENARLLAAIGEEFTARKDRIVSAVAEANCAGYSSDQLDHLLQLSTIKPLLATMWHGADPTLPEGDFNQLTADEEALINRIGNEEWVTRFLSQMDLTSAEALLEEAVLAGFARYQGE